MTIKSTIEQLKYSTGAVSALESANRTESALMSGLLSNDLWEESNYRCYSKQRMRAATTIRNLVRHNAIFGVLEALLDAHLKNPTISIRELLGSLAETLSENEEELIQKPTAHLCAYLIHRIDQIEAKEQTNANRNP